ncbi:aspartokinase [Cenarchaeum symbiosum A]|uniref:Aspartokinase n=1 Tax=Cenarchaeum symbiosum (strain A) TaxID=414004 RepID=A0RXC7_CENSY|nr:aspartokinase [Cenarchaeum symbiosum A]
MERLVVTKFGSSAMGPDGSNMPVILDRIAELGKDAKVVCVFSAPLTQDGGAARSITDVMLDMGESAASGGGFDLSGVKSAYGRVAEHATGQGRAECADIIDKSLRRAGEALGAAEAAGSFVHEARADALAFSGELLMSYLMDAILRSRGTRSAAVPFDSWPIITDDNPETTNFLHAESEARAGALLELVGSHDVVTMGGFIGRTPNGATTTYERGGSDRTAADLGILLHSRYDARIDLAKDSAVVSADPRVVREGLSPVEELSYNEARQAGMFGMKILDPIAIKEIFENGVDIPIVITDLADPRNRTVIRSGPVASNGHPLKIVTGKRNCAMFRAEADSADRLLASLEGEKRYSEFVVLSPFTKNETEFSRVLFLDGDFVRRNERYLRGFDPLAAVTYNRGVITMIGDEMWRVQQVASRASAGLGSAGLNILDMDAQEETSRIIIVIEDSGDNMERAIRAVHAERETIGFV